VYIIVVRNIVASIGCAGLLFFAACAGEPKSAAPPVAVPLPPEPEEIFKIQDHAAKAEGGEIPQWVNTYLYEGLGALENLPEYRNRYLFIAENRGTNMNALRQWSAGFTVFQDFPRLVSTRLQARLTAGSGAGPADNPDGRYGSFFEQTIKNSSDARYYVAVAEDTFWLLVQYFEADGVTLSREVYLFLILVSIDQISLESQINEILNNIPTDTLTKDQITLINQLKENFYTGF
jgi:hypothetical protein